MSVHTEIHLRVTFQTDAPPANGDSVESSKLMDRLRELVQPWIDQNSHFECDEVMRTRTYHTHRMTGVEDACLSASGEFSCRVPLRPVQVNLVFNDSVRTPDEDAHAAS